MHVCSTLLMMISILAGGGRSPLQATPQTSGTQTQTPPPKPATAAKPEDQQPPTAKETVVVSASKTEQELVNAPATMTVIGSQTLVNAPSQNYADVLRQVPGVNVTQISARDINLTSRAASGSLSTSQLALLDGRSLYQDFFGFIMWDFMPVNLDEIKQIEVIRGPASAVWGANALNGVINVITKTPRELEGTTAAFGVGGFDRSNNGNNLSWGRLFYGNGSYAHAVNDRWAYKVSLGAYTQDPFARPTGLIPGSVTGASYPDFTNQGTTQPKLDVRVDYDAPDGMRMSMSGGVAGTSGIMHSGIGPFNIKNGSVQAYGKFNYSRKAFRFQTFFNGLNGDADQLLTRDATGNIIGFSFKTTTFDVEADNTTLAGQHNVFTYGGNVRHNTFDLSIAPGAQPRTEGGGFVQDEIFLADPVRLVLGGRVDKFTSIEGPVFSPRAAIILKPHPDHTFRVSFNRAYRAPSAINNFLDITISEPVALASINPLYGSAIYLLPVHAGGNSSLQEETLDAYEVGYTGVVGKRTTISAAVYFNKLRNEILFTQVGTYGATPPAGFPALGPFPGAAVWAGVVAAGKNVLFPSEFSYRNLGREEDKGFELGFDTSLSARLNAYANYSFQAQPVPSFPGLTADQALAEINLPSKHRVNAGVTFVNGPYVASLSASYVGQAFWQDVLDTPFHGTTKAFTLVNASFGVKFAGGRYQTTVRLTNLANQAVQEHVFGDVMKFQILGELRVRFSK